MKTNSVILELYRLVVGQIQPHTFSRLYNLVVFGLAILVLIMLAQGSFLSR